MRRVPTVILSLGLLTLGGATVSEAQDAAPKERSVFVTREMAEAARANCERHPWAAEVRDLIVERARPWADMTDEALWDLVFGATITRSWMVWSNGHCPQCGEPVPMYNWTMDPLGEPWKVRCPHCKTAFPGNDFGAYCRSGLDAHKVFDPARADRSLLYNTAHPDPNDPLHTFGVDDGEGYVDGENRWRFIGAYLIYGQWKRAILAGIGNLADAYTVTGDPLYAHKAGVLLDRVADVYPTFDFKTQGLVYEKPGVAGYVSTWHDACEEVRELTLDYDQVFDGLQDDLELVAFLSAKAAETRLENPKTSCALIRRNIEDRILRDTLANAWKIATNYPRTEVAKMTILAVFGWPDTRDEVMAIADPMLDKATSVDGVTGEKGLCAYSAYGVQGAAGFLARFSRLDPEFLTDAFERHPRLHEMFRFHLETQCLGEYYPLSGDCGTFGRKFERYAGLSFPSRPSLEPSAYSLLWDAYEITGDPDLVRVLYRANGSKTDGLPYDLFAPDPEAFQERVREVIDREGETVDLRSVNKHEWCLAILRSGEGPNARAVWLDYDSGGAHGHRDAMNLGLYAYGLDLLPDYGYPPVQFGGWGGPKFSWYLASLAHNSAVIDGADSQPGSGRTTLWGEGDHVRLIRASAPELVGAQQYERTVVSVDVDEASFYVLDLFRLVGGASHVRAFGSQFSTLTTDGLSLTRVEGDPFPGSQMRGFASDPAPSPGWTADWRIENRLGYMPEGADIHLRLTDLTIGAEALACEGWIASEGIASAAEDWVPRVLTRSAPPDGAASTFVSVLEPYEGGPSVASARRLPVTDESGRSFADSTVALEVRLASGETDLLVAGDPENPLGLRPSCTEESLVIPERALSLSGEFAWLRLDANGRVTRVALAGARALAIGDLRIEFAETVPFAEMAVSDQGVTVVTDGEAPTVTHAGEALAVER